MYTQARAQLLRNSVRPIFAKLWVNLRTLDTLKLVQHTEPSPHLFIKTFPEQLFDKCIFEFGALEDLTLCSLNRSTPRSHTSSQTLPRDRCRRQTRRTLPSP